MNSPQIIETPQKTEKLTKLERRWYKEYLKTFNSTDAMRKSINNQQYSDNTLWTMASRTKSSVLRKLKVTEEDLLDMMGVSTEALIQKGLDGMNATKPIFVDGKPQAVADYQTRHKYWQDFAKMRNLISDKQKVEITGEDGGPIKVHMIAGIGFLNNPKPDDKDN